MSTDTTQNKIGNNTFINNNTLINDTNNGDLVKTQMEHNAKADSKDLKMIYRLQNINVQNFNGQQKVIYYIFDILRK
jgi:hypothetical protein